MTTDDNVGNKPNPTDVPDRFSERVGGRREDAWDARPGSAITDMNGEPFGTVAGAQTKYIEVDGDDGDHYWLSVATIERVVDGTVQLNFAKSALRELALTDQEQLDAGLDAPTPAGNNSLDALSSVDDEVARRRGLVRDE